MIRALRFFFGAIFFVLSIAIMDKRDVIKVFKATMEKIIKECE